MVEARLTWCFWPRQPCRHLVACFAAIGLGICTAIDYFFPDSPDDGSNATRVWTPRYDAYGNPIGYTNSDPAADLDQLPPEATRVCYLKMGGEPARPISAS